MPCSQGCLVRTSVSASVKHHSGFAASQFRRLFQNSDILQALTFPCASFRPDPRFPSQGPRPSMKPLSLASSLFGIARLVNAQYSSSGWTPGQPVSTLPTNAHPQAAQSTETAGKQGVTPPKPSFLVNLVTGGPLSASSSSLTSLEHLL